MLAIDTELGVPCEADAIEVEVRGMNEPVSVPRTPIAAADLPLTLTLVPGAGVTEASIEVHLLHEGAVVASATSTARFRARESQLLHVVLDASCVAASCDRSETVAFGDVPAPVSRTSCGDEDAGVPIDACVASAELCNDADEDCDGAVDEAFDLQTDRANCGECGHACADIESCDSGTCTTRLVRRYEARPTSFEIFQSACTIPGRTRVLRDVNEREEEIASDIAMPFPFDFYGRRVDHVWIGDNAYIAFSASAPGRTLPVMPISLASPEAPRPAIVPFWELLRTRDSGICFATEGASPTRRLHISWHDVCFQQLGLSCDPGDHLFFSVILEEATNRIVLVYGQMLSSNDATRASGSEASIGVVNDVPAACTACDLNGLCPDGVTPCGYTQISESAAFPDGIPAVILTPTRDR